MKYIFSVIIFLSYSSFVLAQNNFIVSNIPSKLLRSDAVIRMENSTYEYINSTEFIINKKVTTTILTEKGRKNAVLVLHYNKYRKINSIKGIVFNAQGEKIHKLKKKEIRDYGDFSSTIFSDHRMKLVDFSNFKLPFTVQFEYEEEITQSMYLPSWNPISLSQNIEKATFRLITPLEQNIRHKAYNLPQENEKIFKGRRITTWTIKSFIQREYEIFSNPIDHNPKVILAPNEFEFAHIKGNANTWEGFGNWIQLLNSGKEFLSKETISEINKLTSETKNPKDKAKIAYKYMQNKTRYVSIQFGIGGFEPVAASEVDELGYGDCKALTNYMKALLNVIDIPSNYVLVKAGRRATNIDRSFSSSQFNHAFLCVPFKEDTVWLECTSQVNPFGYIGQFTNDRDVLIISKNNSHIAQTPSFDKNDTKLVRNIEINIDIKGNVKGQYGEKLFGLKMDNEISFDFLSNQEKVKIIRSQNDISSLKINNIKNKIFNTSSPIYIQKEFDFSIPKFAPPNGSRMFLDFGCFNQTKIPRNIKERINEFYIKKGFSDIDTIVFNLPTQIDSEYIPENKEIIADFGKYTSQFIYKNQKLIFIRSLIIHSGIYPKEVYEKYRNFLKNINKIETDRAVFIVKSKP